LQRKQVKNLLRTGVFRQFITKLTQKTGFIIVTRDRMSHLDQNLGAILVLLLLVKPKKVSFFEEVKDFLRLNEFPVI